MKNISRWLCCFLVIVMLFSFVTGCRNDSDTSSPEVSGSSSVSESSDSDTGGDGNGTTDTGGDGNSTTDTSGDGKGTTGTGSTTGGSGNNATGSGKTTGKSHITTTTTKKPVVSKSEVGAAAITNPNKIDLKGETVTIRSWWGFQLGEGTGDTVTRMKQMITKIENTFNCKLKIVDTSALPDATLKTSMLSGSPKADLFCTPGAKELYSYVSTGCLQSLEDVKYFDYNDSTKFAHTEVGKIDGKIYAVCPIGYGWIRANAVNILMCNFDVTNAAGYSAEKIYGWVNSGQWTWKKFEEVAKAVSKTGKIVLNDIEQYAGTQFGYDTSYEFYTSLLYSNGTDWVKTVNGVPTFNGADSKAREVMKQYKAWSDAGYIKHKAGTNCDEFKTGQSAFYCSIYPIPIIADWTAGPDDNKNTVGEIPFPKGPSEDEYQWAHYQRYFLCVPKGIKNANKVGAVLNAFCTALYTDAESRLSCKSDLMKTAHVDGSVDLMMQIYDKALTIQTPATLFGYGADLALTKDASKMGWYDYVGNIVKGETTEEAAIQSFTSRCNSILKKTFS